MFTRTALLLSALLACVGLAHADDPLQPDGQAIDISSIVQMVGASIATPDAEQPPFPDFAKVTSGMISKPGMFTLWYYPPGAKDKDPEKLLCQIPSGFLGEQFMLSTSFSGGGFFTGFPLDEHVVKWELMDRQLVLIEPETGYVVDPSKTVSDVVRRTHPDRIRVAVPIVTKSPAGDPVIDLGQLLKSSFANIGWMAGPFGSGINPALSTWTKKKTFELNVEIGVALAVSSAYPPGSFERKLIHYSFWKLPQTDYQPRIADDRVGYFLTTNQDWSKPSTERDIFNRYIDRWHLVKRDPSLKLCEPRQPIIFYIEKTVPVKYRRAVRDGILEWNKAFEQIGFLNAIEVRQQTADNEYKDLDPEDMRYSFFRWIVAGAGFAMGPHRANPFTGQIYDADIIFDDAMVRYFEHEAAQYLPSSIVARKFDDPTLRDFLAAHPEWQRPDFPWEAHRVGGDENAALLERVKERMHHCDRPTCTYMQGMLHEMSVARTLLAGQPPEVIDRFLYDVIKEVVTHEVGHTLGLRHNFKASSIYTLAEIQKRRTTGEATCGSVMDYNPSLLFAENATDGHFITPTIGPYDYWAIEYGYRPFDGNYKSARAEQPADEKKPEENKPVESTGPVEVKIEVAGDTPAQLQNLPPEVLAQLPPEIKQMLASGKLEQMMQAASAGDSPTAPAASKFAAPPSGEAAMLAEIASRASEPELAYATDEDTMFLAPDPLTNRFDMGRDPVDWAKTRFALVDARMKEILDWAVKDGESWYHLSSAFLTLMVEKALVMDYVGRFVGGQYFTRAHRGDPNAPAPFVLVEPERQRAALKFISDHLYDAQFFDVPPEVLNHLAPSRWWHDGSNVSFTMDFPVHRYIALLQWWNLFDRLYPNTLRRIQDNELKTDAADRLTAAEYIRSIRNACWHDATDHERVKSGKWTDTHPFVSPVRRSLQREYLGIVEPMVRARPGTSLSPDLHAMLTYALVELSTDLDATANNQAIDFASRAHLQACKSRIERILSAELSENQPFRFGGVMFMQPAGQER